MAGMELDDFEELLESAIDKSSTKARAKTPSTGNIATKTEEVKGSGAEPVEMRKYKLSDGRAIDLEAVDIVPTDYVVHWSNRRNESLLTTDVPKIKSMLVDMDERGQAERGIARWIMDKDGNRIPEVLEGVCRGFCSKQRYKKDKSVRFELWMPKSEEISEVEARYIALQSNKNRDDVSAWENAQYYKKLEGEGKTPAEIGAMEPKTKSEKWVRETLKLAAIPVDVVSLMCSPGEISVKSGAPIARLVATLDKKQIKKMVGAIRTPGGYQTSADLKKAIVDWLPKPAEKKQGSRHKEEIKKGNKVRVKIGQHRDNDDQYKIDCFDFSQSDIKKLEDFLRKNFS